MAQKKIPYLQAVKPPEDMKEVKKKARKFRGEKLKRMLVPVILAALAVCGTYLLLTTKRTDRPAPLPGIRASCRIRTATPGFPMDIVRYNRDGVVFLDRKNEEQWI